MCKVDKGSNWRSRDLNPGQSHSIVPTLNHDTEGNCDPERSERSPSVLLAVRWPRGEGGQGDWKRRLSEGQVPHSQRLGYSSTQSRRGERGSLGGGSERRGAEWMEIDRWCFPSPAPLPSPLPCLPPSTWTDSRSQLSSEGEQSRRRMLRRAEKLFL